MKKEKSNVFLDKNENILILDNLYLKLCKVKYNGKLVFIA